MNARTVVWSAAFAAVTITGCGLTLDYGPPSVDGGGSVMDAGNGCSSSCDDGLSCTADACVSGTCQHTSTCGGNTDCVARAGVGECRRACTSADDCADDNACTTDVCDPTDHHCAHVSNCQTARPTCLETGVCAPDHCTANTDCDDGNLCNGAELCTSGTCRAGTPVACDAGSGCISNTCDPMTGVCARVLDATQCADSFSCTADVCNSDGTCAHPPDNSLCSDADLCTTATCNPSSATDSTGCVTNAASACPTACGIVGTCVPATGMCSYDAACPAGEVCRSDGCHSPGTCSSSSDCHAIRSADGCQTVCASGTCAPPVCPPPPVGGCGVIDPTTCSTGVCGLVASPSLCTDSDPLSMDLCDPTTFACSHSCPAPAGSCVSYTYMGGSCVPTFNNLYCAAAHAGGNVGDCARSRCTGTSATGGGDGCEFVGVDTLCTDAIGCTTDTCSVNTSGVGTCHSVTRGDVDTYCSDDMDCTTDACDPANVDPSDRTGTGCTHTPHDDVCQTSAGTLACATAYCAQTGSLGNMLGTRTLPTGCAVDYEPGNCDAVASAICTLDGQCQTVACSGGCDDGVACNGTEVCDSLLRHCVQDVFDTCAIGAGTSCNDVCTPMGCVAPQTAACGVMTIMD